MKSPQQEVQLGGTFTGISLTSFLQMLAWEKKSSAVHVSSGGKDGVLYVDNGQLVDAETAVNSGLDAFFAIHGWPEPLIKLAPLVSRKQYIDLPLTQILLEATKLQDEQNFDASQQAAVTEKGELQPLPDNDKIKIIKLLMQLPEIVYCALIDSNGQVIAQSSNRPKFQIPFRFALLAGNEIRKIFGEGEAQYLQLTDASNEVLLLVPERDRVIGLHLRKTVPIRELISRIRDLLLHKEQQERDG